MKVSSPIGELPFEPTRVAIKNGGIEVQGRMGAWPAHVQVDATDLPAIARLLVKPVAAAAAATAVVLGLARVASSRNRTPGKN